MEPSLSAGLGLGAVEQVADRVPTTSLGSLQPLLGPAKMGDLQLGHTALRSSQISMQLFTSQQIRNIS